MNLLPDNIAPDKYLGKGIEFLYLFIVLILIILIAIFFGFSYKEISIGDIGAILSGTIGIIVALLVAIFTFLAFYVQYDANKKIQSQFKYQQSSDQFYTMLNLHNKNVQEFSINSFQNSIKEVRYEVNSNSNDVIKDSKSDLKSIITKILNSGHQEVSFEILQDYKDNLKPINNIVRGRRCFLLMIKDLHFAIFCVQKINQTYNIKLDRDDELEFAYKIFFWGTNSSHINFSDTTKNGIALKIKDKLNELKFVIRNNAQGDKISFDYYSTNGKFGEYKGKEDHFRFIPLSGHSSRLAHYFRHLYQTVKQVHLDIENENITMESGLRFLNTLRAQMSNQEQLLLYYNYRIGFGEKWDKRYDRNESKRGKYEFLTKYRMIHNIPLYNTIYEDVEHPEDHFKEFIIANPTFDLFEWS